MTLKDKLLQLKDEFNRIEVYKDSTDLFRIYVYPKMKAMLALVTDNIPDNSFMREWEKFALIEVTLDLEQKTAPALEKKNIEISSNWLNSYKEHVQELVDGFINQSSRLCPRTLEQEIF